MAAISPAYVQTMAAYNGEMNRRVYGAAAELSDAERRAERGAFFGSIHGTLNHLLWADRQWMSRFDGWEKPIVAIRGSPGMIEAFEELRDARVAADARLIGWAAGVRQDWLDGALSWFSGASQADMHKPRDLLVMHFFNHQTHHRGQVHAMLTAAGRDTGATDLPWIV